MTSPLYGFSCNTLSGEALSLAQFRGHVLVIVNTASQCGLTPQYEQLEALYKKYKEQGLVILGFPCNQFGKQEPGSANEITKFCELNYGVSFPMFEKTDVNGPNTAALYKHLKKEAPGVFRSQGIKWNFTKFLVDRSGDVVRRFAPATKPKTLEKEIIALLSATHT